MKNVFHINRHIEPGQYRLVEVFPDIRTCDILSAIFADAEEIDRVLANTEVVIVGEPTEVCNEMSVDNNDGSITINQPCLHRSSDEILYLDIIHELCHVKQHLQGRNLYDTSKSYVDRETEIEAYQVTVREARRIGLSDDAIFDYLCVSWITPEEQSELARRLGVTAGIQEGGLQ